MTLSRCLTELKISGNKLDITWSTSLEEKEFSAGRVPVGKRDHYDQVPPLMAAPQKIERP